MYTMKIKTALITGATSGIGKATAFKFAANLYNIIITGRRKDRLEQIASEISEKFGVKVLPLCFDIRDKNKVVNAIDTLDAPWRAIDILVNNAGLALGLSPMQEGDTEDWDTMIDTNLKGLFYISRVVSNLMIKNGKGHIINIGSIAGKEAYPNGNVYSATKHAVNGFTKGMRLDLLKHGIKVSQVAPGAVETEFSNVRFKGDKKRADLVYKGYKPLSGEDIADAIFYVASLPDHVNINDLLIMPLAQANATTFLKD
jgi:NADP-dependent 3-hydroxy acid dehydrogenase YdfG